MKNALILIFAKNSCAGDHAFGCDDDCDSQRRLLFAADNFKEVNEWVESLEKHVKEDFVWEIWRAGDCAPFRAGEIKRVETTVYAYKVVDDVLNPVANKGWQYQGEDPSVV